MSTVQQDHTIYVTGARLSFPKLIEAVVSSQGGEPKFGCDLILNPSDPQIAAIMADVQRVAIEKWKDLGPGVLQMIQNDRRLRCYGSGNEKVKTSTMKPYEGYEGMFYLNTSSNEDRPPQIVRPDDGKIIDNANTMERTAAARKLYGGCYVNAAIRFWPQDNQFGKAIRCQLFAIQFLKDGEAFGEAPPDLTMFKPTAPQQPAGQPAGGMPSFFGGGNPFQ